MKQAVGRSNGKVILMGEHAVVYGEPALALPFSSVETIAKVSETNVGHLTVDSAVYDGLVHQMPKFHESLKHAIRFSLYRLGQSQNPSIHISIESSIPAKRGMGSSAAVAVAVARGLFSFYETELTDQELWEIVQSSEKIAHGNPSGVDTVATSGKDPVFYIKNQPIQTFQINLSAYLVVADTGVIGHTIDAVRHVADWVQVENEGSCDLMFSPQGHIALLGKLTRSAKQALIDNDPVFLGKLMNQAQKLLTDLGVSDNSLDYLIEVARQQGALGAKLTGGGRGGCMIALADTQFKAESIAQALKQAGACQTWIQSLDLETEHNNLYI